MCVCMSLHGPRIKHKHAHNRANHTQQHTHTHVCSVHLLCTPTHLHAHALALVQLGLCAPRQVGNHILGHLARGGRCAWGVMSRRSYAPSRETAAIKGDKDTSCATRRRTLCSSK